MDETSALTPSQASLLEQFQSISNLSDRSTCIQVLSSSGWDLQAALGLIYDNPEAPPPPPPPATATQSQSRIEELDFDDSEQRGLINGHDVRGRGRGGRRRERGGNNNNYGVLQVLWMRTRFLLSNPPSILAIPLSFLYNLTVSLLSLIARLLRIRPNLPSLSIRSIFSSGSGSSGGGSSMTTRLRSDPRSCAERWVRSLEEEVAFGPGLALLASGSDIGPGSTSSAGPFKRGAVSGGGPSGWASGSSSRSGSMSGSSRPSNNLPSFEISSYKSALEKAKSSYRVLMVILDSSEHQDSPLFRKSVLTDPELLTLLEEKNLVVWGGDVKDRDAYETSKLLQATTFPFVAFIALQSRNSSVPGSSTSSASQPTKMTVLSRLEGSPASTTSASTIINHITTTLLPRCTPLLNRLRNEKTRIERDRKLREEQDRAYEEAARRDVERIKRKMELEEEERRRKVEEERKEKEKLELGEKRDRWRKWAVSKDGLVTPEPGLKDKEVVTLAIRFGNVGKGPGRRVVRKFRKEDTIESLFAYVECEALGISSSSSSEGSQAGLPPQPYEHEFTFQLATVLPRSVIAPDQRAMKVGDVGALKSGATLVVEGTILGGDDGTLQQDEEEEDEEEEEEE